MSGRKKPVRTIRQARAETQETPGVIVVRTGATAQYYVYREIPCQIGGRGLAMHRLGLGELYHVRIGTPVESGCECLGYLRHGHCKHIEGLKALKSKGLL